MISFVLQNINPVFFLSSKPLNMLSSTFLVVCLFLNTLVLLFFAVKFITELATPISLHFNLKKHYSYLSFNVLTTVDLFYLLFWGFKTFNRYAGPFLFVGRVQKRKCYFSVTTLTAENLSGTFFMVCFSLNMFLLPFSGIVTWKMRQGYLSCSSFHAKYTKHTLLPCL